MTTQNKQTYDILSKAFREAVLASRKVNDFADKCAITLAIAMRHIEHPEWNESLDTTKFLFENYDKQQ